MAFSHWLLAKSEIRKIREFSDELFSLILLNFLYYLLPGIVFDTREGGGIKKNSQSELRGDRSYLALLLSII